MAKPGLSFLLICIVCFSVFQAIFTSADTITEDEILNKAINIAERLLTKVSQCLLDAASAIQGQLLSMKALLTYENKTPVPAQEIDFYANATFIGSNFTNLTGWASIDWDTSGFLGNYSINMSFAGDQTLGSSFNDLRSVQIVENTNTTGSIGETYFCYWFNDTLAYNRTRTQYLNLTVEENRTYEWVLDENCTATGCALDSILVLGYISLNSSGHGKVYIDNGKGEAFLMLNKTFALRPGGNRTGNETDNQTIIVSYAFDDECMDTCSLTGWNFTQASYMLIFEVANATIHLDRIKYTWRWEEATENATIPENVTEENATVPEVIEITEMMQQRLEIGKPVKLARRVKAMNETIARLGLPEDAESVVITKEMPGVYHIEYETPAPYKEENIIDPFIPGKEYRKAVTIKSDFSGHYMGVRSWTDIPEELSELSYTIRLYHIINGNRVDVTDNPEYYVFLADSDGNGVADGMEWTVPELSAQMFEVVAEKHGRPVPGMAMWKEKMEGAGMTASIVNLTGRTRTVLIEKSGVGVEFGEFDEAEADWDRTVEITQDANRTAIDDFLSGSKLGDFVWVETNGFLHEGKYRARIVLPSTYRTVFACEGTREEPQCFMIQECGERPCYETKDGKSVVLLNHFSGAGGADLTVIDVQSYPTLYGNWTVRFNTTGTANLTITAVNGTTWSNSNEDNQLKFLEIRCGNEILNYEWVDNGLGNSSVFVENYSCNETGYEISKVLIAGKHTLEFRFGDDVEYAYNSPSFGYTTPGATAESLVNYIRGSVFTIPQSGTANSITAYVALKAVLVSRPYKYAIYKHSDLSLVGQTTVGSYSGTNEPAWKTLNMVGSPTLEANTEYILVAWSYNAGLGYANIYYDAGDTDQGHIQSLALNGWPDPLVPTHNDYKYSIFCNYTADGTPPTWSNNITSPTSPATYSPTQTYQFNVTWNDNFGISTVLIEHNLTGSSTPHNDTVTTYKTISGNQREYYFDVSGLAVGAYVWRSYANDSTGNANKTDQWAYTVSKASPSISVGPLTSVTYGTATETGCGRVTGDSSSTLTLYRNGTQVASDTTSPQNESSIVLGAGTYNYTCTISTTQNYSASSSANQYRTVNKASPQARLALNGTEDDKTYVQGQVANLTAWPASVTLNVTIYANYSGQLQNITPTSNSPVTNFTDTGNLGGGVYYIILANVTGSANWTANSTGVNYTMLVSAITLTPTLESLSPASVNQAQNSTAVGNCSCTGGTCNSVYIEIQADGSPIPSTSGGNLQVNGSSSYSLGNLNDGTSAKRSWNITGWEAGTYAIRIKCNSTETGSVYSSTTDLKVNDTAKPTWSGNATSPDSGSQYAPGADYQFNVTWTDNVGINAGVIEHNFTGSPTPHNDSFTGNAGSEYYFDIQDLAAGTYVWRSYANDSAGNANKTDQWVYTVNRGDVNIDMWLNGNLNSDKTIAYPTQANATCKINITSQNSFTLLQNGTSKGTQSGQVVEYVASLAAQSFNFTCNYSQTQNYSAFARTNYLTISKGSPQARLALNGTENNKLYLQGQVANLTAWANNSGPNGPTVKIYTNYTGTLQEIASDTTSVTNFTDTTNLATGSYLIKSNITGNANWTDNSTGINYTMTVQSQYTVTFYPVLGCGIIYLDGVYYGLQDNITNTYPGEDSILGSNYAMRAFYRFDVSSIPDDATVFDANLSAYYYESRSGGTPEGVLMLGEVQDIGTCTADDWSASLVRSYGQVIGQTTDYGWYSMDVTDSITPASTYVTFRYNDTIEDYDSNYWRWRLYTWEAGKDAHLNVTYGLDYAPTISTDAAINNTTAVVPANTVVKWNVTVTDDNGVSKVFFQNSTGNYSATQNVNEWYITQTCTASKTEGWQKIFANDTINQWSTNASVGLAWECDAAAPAVANTGRNATSVYTNSYICVNHTASDAENHLDKTWVQITFPNNTKTNITTVSSGDCCIAGNSRCTNVNVGSTTGTLTVNTSFANDTVSQVGYQSPYPNLEVTVQSDNPPKYLGNYTSIPSESQYRPGRNYGFQINFTDGEGVSKVFFEANLNESLKNYTVPLYAGTATNGLYAINFTDIGAGSYQYRWLANDTTNQWNTTGIIPYTVAQNTSTIDFMNLTINGTESNKQYTYPAGSNATGWYDSNVFAGQTITFTLWRNTTEIGTSNPVNDVEQLAAGFYNYTYYTTGNTNYTSAQKQFNLTISQGSPVVLLALNDTQGDKTYTYPEAIGASASESNTGDSDCTYTLWRDGVSKGTGSSVSENILLGNATYVYEYNTTGCTNYTSTSLSRTAYVNKGYLALSISASPSWSVTYPAQTTVTGTESNIGDSDVTYQLWRNSTMVDNTDPWQDVQTLGQGTYTYRFNATVGANWTANATGVSNTLTVSQNNTNPVDLYFRNSTGEYKNQNMTITYGTQSNATGLAVYGSSAGTVYVYRNGVQEASGAGAASGGYVTLGAGTYTYKVNVTGNSNYTSNSTGVEYYVIVNQADPTTNMQLTIDGSSAAAQTRTYPNTTNTVATETNVGDGDCTYGMKRDGVFIGAFTEQIQLAARPTDDYDYSYYVLDCANYTDGGIERGLTVNRGGVNIDMWLNGTLNSDRALTYPSNLNATCKINVTSQNTFTMLKNGTSVGSQSVQVIEYSFESKADSFNFTCNYSQTQNYSAFTRTQYLTLSRGTTSTSCSLSPTSPITYETQTTAYCYSNATETKCNLYRNSTNKTSENNTAVMLGAGSYNYTCFAAQTENYTSSSQENSYIVNTKNANCQVSPSTQTVTYPAPVTQYCACSAALHQCTLWRNNTNITTANNTAVVYGSGSHGFVSNISDSSNYTNYQATSTLTVSQNSSTQNFMNLTINGTESNLSGTYPITTNATGWYDSSAFIGPAPTFTLYRNTSTIGTGNPVSDVLTLPAEDFNYTYYTAGNTNYSAATKQFNISIDRGSVNIDMWLNGNLNSDKTITYPTQANATCKINISSQNAFSLLQNGSSEGTQSGQVIEYIASLAAQSFNFTCNYSQTQNYSAFARTNYLTIGKGNPTSCLKLALNGTEDNLTQTYPQAVNATGWCTLADNQDLSFTLYRNGNSKATGDPATEEMLLGNATYNYTYYASEGGNYTSAQVERTYKVLKGTVSPYLQISPDGWTHVYPTATVVSCKVSSVNGEVDSAISLYRAGVSKGTEEEATFGAGSYVYETNTSETANYTANTTGESKTLTIDPGPTLTQLFLNGTQGDRSYNKTEVANITATTNVSSLTVKIYSNYTDGLQEIASNVGSVTNFTDTGNLAQGPYLIKANTTGNENYTSSQVNYTLSVVRAWLEVNLTNPDPGVCTEASPCSRTQYQAFAANATVICRSNPSGYGCGEVNGSVRYNETGTEPNKLINTTEDTPFYIGPEENPISCGSLSDGQSCQLNWTVNATGPVDSVHVIDVNFSSSYPNSSVPANHTADAYVEIAGVDQTKPTWRDNKTKILSPAAYAPGQNYGFEVNFTDNIGMHNVLFHSDYNGTWANYSCSNDTATVFYYNLTDLPANTTGWSWQFIGNDTSYNKNATDTWTYMIAKGSTEMKLWLNDTRGDYDYYQYNPANFTAELNVTGKTIYLTSNMTGFGTLSGDNSVIYNTTHLTEVGVFNMTAYWDGDENCTADSETWYANVSASIISISISTKLGEGVFFTNVTGAEQNVQYDVKIGAWNNGTWNYNATDSKTEYWIKNTGTSPQDFCINATTDLTCTGGACGSGVTIPINNVSWSNATTNDADNPAYDTTERLSATYTKVGYSIGADSYLYLRFWLYAPSKKPSGRYNTTFAVRTVEAGNPC